MTACIVGWAHTKFGKLEGGAFLGMVQRKVVWLQRNADRLVELVAG